MSHFEVTATDGAARAGILRTAHGEVRTPAFMPVGTKGTVKSLDPDELRTVGSQIILGNTYHLHFRPGDELIARARRPARVLGLGRADPDRLGRLPGLLAPRHAARGRRRRRHLPLRLRRRLRALLARDRRADPAQPRLRHRDGVRHLPARRRSARRARGGGPADDALGRAPARGGARAGPAALRDRAGRRGRGAAPPLDRGDRRARLRRPRARRARGGGEPRGDVRGDRLGGAAPPGRASRATSWGSATPRAFCG